MPSLCPRVPTPLPLGLFHIALLFIAFPARAAPATAPATYPTHAAAWNDFAGRALDVAIARAAEMDDPRPAVAMIARAASRTDPPAGLDRIRRAAGVLEAARARRRLPPQDSSTYGTLAVVVGRQDVAMRDEFLAKAVEEGDAALDAPAVWKAVPAAGAGGGWPQRLKDQARQLLWLRVKLWKGVLAARADRDDGVGRLTEALIDAKGIQVTLVDASADAAVLVGQEMAALDPDLFKDSAPPRLAARIAPASAVTQWGVPADAPAPRRFGPERWSADDRGRRVDALRRQLGPDSDPAMASLVVRSLFQLGEAEGMRALGTVMAQYPPGQYRDMADALAGVSPAALVKLYKASPTAAAGGRFTDFAYEALLQPLARADPDLAEREARKLPEPTGTVALAYVAAGIARTDWPRARALAESLPPGRRVPNYLAERLMADPAATADITGEHRQSAMEEAAGRLCLESGNLAGYEKMVATLADLDEVDLVTAAVCDALTHYTPYYSDDGPRFADYEASLKLLGRIRKPYIAVSAAKAMVDRGY